VAALLHLAQALQRHDIANAGDIWFVANVGEEGLGDLRGMRAACDRLGDRIAAAIALEGTGPDRVIHAGLGVRRYRISAAAPGGHSWQNFGAPSAIHALVRLAERYPGRLEVVPSAQVRRVLDISGLGDQPWLTQA